jgi:hypothetical protein
VVVVDDVVVVVVARLIDDAVAEAGLTAYAVSAAFTFHRNAFAADPPRMLVVVPPRPPCSRGADSHLTSPKCHVQSLQLSSW